MLRGQKRVLILELQHSFSFSSSLCVTDASVSPKLLVGSWFLKGLPASLGPPCLGR